MIKGVKSPCGVRLCIDVLWRFRLRSSGDAMVLEEGIGASVKHTHLPHPKCLKAKSGVLKLLSAIRPRKADTC